MNLRQNLKLKFQQHNITGFRKKKFHQIQNMEVQSNQNTFINLQIRKHSENTCASSNGSHEGSPNSDQKSINMSAVKSFSTGLSSPHSQVTPQKEFCSTSMDNIISLQKRTHSSNEVNEKRSRQTQMDTRLASVSLSMVEETQQQSQERHYLENKIKLTDQREISKKNIVTNIKLKQLTDSTHIVKNNIQTQSKTQCKNTLEQTNKNNNITQNTSNNVSQTKPSQIQTKPSQPSSTQQADNRPLPSYKQARPALYIWIRTLCSQMNVCLDVFALTMKYLDQYHNTYGNAYNRYTFTEHAYGMIILAAKVANKKILTPRVIAPKANMKRQRLQQIQMGLIRMMNFQVYFETFVKLLQIRCQKWEESCERRNLKLEYSLFKENLCSFKKFYCLLKEVQSMARVNNEVTKDMLLDGFIKSLGPEFKLNQRQQLLAEILSEVFDDLTADQHEQSDTTEMILTKINESITSTGNQYELRQKLSKNFERRNNKELFETYNVFLNSIFDIKL